MNTPYFLNCVAGNLFHTKETPAIPEAYYIGLSTTEPNKDGSGVTEPPASAGYQRVMIEHLSAPTDGKVSNEKPISFSRSTSNWGTVTHYVIFDSPAVGSGNLLIYDELSAQRTMEADTVLTFEEGCLELLVQNSE